MRIAQEEQFGPCTPILKYNNIEEIKEFMKKTEFGQQASVFTQSGDDLVIYFLIYLEKKKILIFFFFFWKNLFSLISLISWLIMSLVSTSTRNANVDLMW